MTDRIKLSVVMVARNEEKNIARCIVSVLKHTRPFEPVEILLVDSVSTDHTVEIASAFPVNIISLRSEWFLSPGAGRFSGVNNIVGEYVLIIDGDMELLPGWLDAAVHFLDGKKNAVGVGGLHYNAGLGLSLKESLWRHCRESRGETKKVYQLPGSALFRREALLKAGNFHPYLRAEEEAECSARLILGGGDLYLLPVDAVYHYPVYGMNIQETFRRMRKGLYAGFGDLTSWCFSKRYYALFWRECGVYCLFIGMILLFFLLSAMFSGTAYALWPLAFPVVFCFLMIIKKRSVLVGLLSVFNIAVIAWNVFCGFFYKVQDISTYPRDVVWKKKYQTFV